MTLPARPDPTAMSSRPASSHPPPRGAADVAEWYRRRFGWPVEAVTDEVRLSLTGGLVAFEVPAHHARDVLARLTSLGASGPALRTGAREGRVAFLCDVNDSVFTQADMPLGVTHLRAPTSLPLPLGPSASWFAPPAPDRRWLPSAGAVLHAVRRTLAEAACEMANGIPSHPGVWRARPREPGGHRR